MRISCFHDIRIRFRHIEILDGDKRIKKIQEAKQKKNLRRHSDSTLNPVNKHFLHLHLKIIVFIIHFLVFVDNGTTLISTGTDELLKKGGNDPNEI